ncbi:MAG TPA: apolipoprotein N-acyltransferase [Acidobacteriaceae bacterium]|jgi:apolipoprotein N-acyltransferase|nr:apolipoprotein N-acyltransferase [Acidobacteriaceae bacterium]
MQSTRPFAYLLASLSAFLLVLPFPIAGPTPAWHVIIAWCALVPLLCALLLRSRASGVRLIVRNLSLGYLCGILWYGGTCYWIYQTMYLYGNLPRPVAVVLLVLFCLYLGLYHALFALLVTLTHRATGKIGWTLFFSPFLWVAMELACARITSFPWNQLGVSQVDNLLFSRLATWTGVYGISFFIVAVNCAFAAAILLRGWRTRTVTLLAGIALAACLQACTRWKPAPEPAPATAMMLQPNLNVDGNDNWSGDAFDIKMQHYAALSEDRCNPYIAGMPGTSAPLQTPDCSSHDSTKRMAKPINIILWPESPAPFWESDPRFQHWMAALAQDAHAPIIVGDSAAVRDPAQRNTDVYVSASFINPDGAFAGRYDKMHLVPFGEYIPFQNLLWFAHSLTEQVGRAAHGKHRVVFTVNGHNYGTFICYESIFAVEVRQFALLGADVLVNISDDGWYGDTSAPWQHLNMTRMRAIENHRWLLLDTNSGVTAAIDPYGRVMQSLPRHTESSLAANFGYLSDHTFYTLHGDIFAWLCAIIAIVLAVDGCIQHPQMESESSPS